MPALIEADKLSLIRGQRLLFKNLSLTLERGEAIHLVGDNGSGKTSLFKVLTGLLAPDSGRLKLMGKPVADCLAADYQQLIYLGHQTAIKQELTVSENLRLNAALFDCFQATNQQLSIALESVGLARFSQQMAGCLSAGQKRRVMLARLWLLLDSNQTLKSIWLLDEPLTALDVKVIEDLQVLIARHLALGGGVIFTSHQRLDLTVTVKKQPLGVLR